MTICLCQVHYNDSVLVGSIFDKALGCLVCLLKRACGRAEPFLPPTAPTIIQSVNINNADRHHNNHSLVLVLTMNTKKKKCKGKARASARAPVPAQQTTHTIVAAIHETIARLEREISHPPRREPLEPGLRAIGYTTHIFNTIGVPYPVAMIKCDPDTDTSTTSKPVNCEQASPNNTQTSRKALAKVKAAVKNSHASSTNIDSVFGSISANGNAAVNNSHASSISITSNNGSSSPANDSVEVNHIHASSTGTTFINGSPPVGSGQVPPSTISGLPDRVLNQALELNELLLESLSLLQRQNVSLENYLNSIGNYADDTDHAEHHTASTPARQLTAVINEHLSAPSLHVSTINAYAPAPGAIDYATKYAPQSRSCFPLGVAAQPYASRVAQSSIRRSIDQHVCGGPECDPSGDPVGDCEGDISVSAHISGHASGNDAQLGACLNLQPAPKFSHDSA